MIVLNSTQKQSILKYVEDKTYFKRCCFIISTIISIGCIIGLIIYPMGTDLFPDLVGLLCTSIILLASTLKDVIKFRNVKYNLDINNFVAVNKYLSDACITQKVQKTNYENSLKDSSMYKLDNPPRNFEVIIQKYYILDKYSNKYECIKYLDYKKCIEEGEFIAIDFPTGEKIAMCK